MGEPRDRDLCDFCDRTASAAERVRGRRASICHACVAASITASIARPAGEARGHELPEADRPCSFCDKATPASALVDAPRGDTTICTLCLGRAYAFIGEALRLEHRRLAWRSLGEESVPALLAAHFAGAGEVVTSSRTFPEYMRVDLNRTLQALLEGPGSRCVGLHQRYGHETLQYATLLQRDDQVQLVPLQLEDVDIGEARPARCLTIALWLRGGPTVRHAVLLSPARSYGRSSGWHVEIAVPAGEAGESVVRGIFDAVEEALARSASYRGKVLSLEHEEHMMGMGGRIIVHRLAPVAREEVILPAATLSLLERNVFTFAEQRAALRAMGFPVKKGLLFYGPPGTGKTHTIRYLAGALSRHTTLLITAEQIGTLARYMTLARLLAPSIVVIEDADLVARGRQDLSAAQTEALLNRLLNEMDGLKENSEILFILTTNRPEALEPALTARPGRIDQAIEFPLPDTDGRRKLARLYGRGSTYTAETLEHVVERTADVSAAFIKELMRRSAQFALERGGGVELTRGDVDAALEELLFSGGSLNATLLGAASASRAGTRSPARS